MTGAASTREPGATMETVDERDGANATRQGGWHNVRRGERAGLPRAAARWTAPDVALTVVAFIIHWEVGLAFLALKLWHQASGYQGSVFSFARARNGRLWSGPRAP